MHIQLSLFGPSSLEGRTQIREPVSDESSPGHLGLIATRVIIWLPGLVARDSGLITSKSDLERAGWFPRPVTGDNGWSPGLVAIDYVSSIFICGPVTVCLYIQSLKVQE